MIFGDLGSFLNLAKDAVKISKKGIEILDEECLKDKVLDYVIYNVALNESQDIKDILKWFIWEVSRKVGIYLSSIQKFYEAMGRRECGGFTVPAVNIRGLTYDTARAIIRTAMKNESGAFVFELSSL